MHVMVKKTTVITEIKIMLDQHIASHLHICIQTEKLIRTSRPVRVYNIQASLRSMNLTCNILSVWQIINWIKDQIISDFIQWVYVHIFSEWMLTQLRNWRVTWNLEDYSSHGLWCVVWQLGSNISGELPHVYFGRRTQCHIPED
jgi:hypothetical protein